LCILINYKISGVPRHGLDILMNSLNFMLIKNYSV